MPSVTVNLSFDDLVRIREESKKRNVSASAVVRERVTHVCAPSKDDRDYAEFKKRARVGKPFDWVLTDGREVRVSPAK
jgi:hypothetical protein